MSGTTAHEWFIGNSEDVKAIFQVETEGLPSMCAVNLYCSFPGVPSSQCLAKNMLRNTKTGSQLHAVVNRALSLMVA